LEAWFYQISPKNFTPSSQSNNQACNDLGVYPNDLPKMVATIEKNFLNITRVLIWRKLRCMNDLPRGYRLQTVPVGPQIVEQKTGDDKQ
jgi:hypothetical protein